MSFRSSGNILILHTRAHACTIPWGQDSPVFPSCFQRDPKKDEEPVICPWLVLCELHKWWEVEAGGTKVLHNSGGQGTVPWKQPSLLLWPLRSSLASRSARGHHNFGLLLGLGNHQFPVKEKTEAHWAGRFRETAVLLAFFRALGLVPCPVTDDSHWDWSHMHLGWWV